MASCLPTNKGTEIVNKNCKASSSTTGAISLKTMRQVFSCAISSFESGRLKPTRIICCVLGCKTKFFGLIKMSCSGSSTSSPCAFCDHL